MMKKMFIFKKYSIVTLYYLLMIFDKSTLRTLKISSILFEKYITSKTFKEENDEKIN
jgi:hypothetical protein